MCAGWAWAACVLRGCCVGVDVCRGCGEPCPCVLCAAYVCRVCRPWLRVCGGHGASCVCPRGDVCAVVGVVRVSV